MHTVNFHRPVRLVADHAEWFDLVPLLEPFESPPKIMVGVISVHRVAEQGRHVRIDQNHIRVDVFNRLIER